MIDSVIVACLKTIATAVDTALIYCTQVEMQENEAECPCPTSELELTPGSTMGDGSKTCKQCGKQHPVDYEGGDSE